MNSRRIEERFEAPHSDGSLVIGEWEPSTRVDVRELRDGDITAWVRAANKRAKVEGEYVRFRSREVEDNW